MTNNWQTVKLGDVCEFNPTESIKKGTLAKKIAMDKLLPFQREISGVELAKYSGGTKFRNGDTLIARITPCLENGKTSMVNILELDEVAFGSTEFIVLREKKNISDSFFLYYLSVSPAFRKVAIKSMVGSSGRQRVQLDVLKNLEISLPSLAEQERIAGVLSALDDKIENNNAINKKLEEMAQAIFKSYFIDFTPFNGSMPHDWKIGKLSDIAEVVGGGTPSTKKLEYYCDKGIPWITPKDLSGYTFKYIERGNKDITDEGLKNSSARLMPKGTILFSSRAPIGYISIAKGEVSTNQGFKSMIPKEFFYSEYIFQSIKYRTAEIENSASGSTFKEVSGSVMKNIDIIIPSEQILKKYEERISPINKNLYKNQREILTLTQLRDSLLPKLMSGEIKV